MLALSAADVCGEVALDSRGEGALEEAGGRRLVPPSTEGVGVGAEDGFFGVPLLGSELLDMSLLRPAEPIMEPISSDAAVVVDVEVVVVCGSNAGQPELLWGIELDQGSEPEPKEVVKLAAPDPTSLALEASAFGFQGSDPESSNSFSVNPFGFH